MATAKLLDDGRWVIACRTGGVAHGAAGEPLFFTTEGEAASFASHHLEIDEAEEMASELLDDEEDWNGPA